MGLPGLCLERNARGNTNFLSRYPANHRHTEAIFMTDVLYLKQPERQIRNLVSTEITFYL